MAISADQMSYPKVKGIYNVPMFDILSPSQVLPSYTLHGPAHYTLLSAYTFTGCLQQLFKDRINNTYIVTSAFLYILLLSFGKLFYLKLWPVNARWHHVQIYILKQNTHACFQSLFPETRNQSWTWMRGLTFLKLQYANASYLRYTVAFKKVRNKQIL